MYLKVKCGNGYCGCDEEWLMEIDENASDKEIVEDIRNTYTYLEGADGLNPKDPDEEDFEPDYDISWDEYDENISDRISWEEISQEEFKRLNEEEWFEIR